MLPQGTQNVGAIYAVSVESGSIAWKREQRAGTGSILATAGGLLFGGDLSGHFRCLDQRTGAVLWEINLGSPVVGPAITYAVNGKQYVAVSTGRNLYTGTMLSLSPEIQPSFGNNLFVFALP